MPRVCGMQEDYIHVFIHRFQDRNRLAARIITAPKDHLSFRAFIITLVLDFSTIK